MHELVRLCTIALEVPYNDQQEDEALVSFHYHNKHWRLLEFLHQPETIKEIISIINGEHSWSTKFMVKAIDERDKTWLVLCFKNSSDNRGLGRLHIPPFILSTFFHQVDAGNTVHQRNHDHTNGIIKKYVTTILFDALYQKHFSLAPDDVVDVKLPECFRPKLCRYQQRAVNWLYKREQQPTKIQLYVRLRGKDNETTVYVHKFYMHLLGSQPEAVELPKGGILADEMGLGKTVEILALILLHKRARFEEFPQGLSMLSDNLPSPKRQCMSTVFCLCGSDAMRKVKSENIHCNKCQLWQHKECVCKYNEEHADYINDPYVCPKCWSDVAHKKKQLVQSGATIIVSPNTIKLQWLAEIHKHVHPSLRVFLYEGVAKNRWINPRQLADHDIVLTDYSVLRKEFYHTAENESDRVTRRQPRHMRCNTPLLMVQWWRVCLDEAQMVESNLSLTAKLAFQLPAINRWAVTGTPIQSSIDDLHSLLAFIGFDKICQPRAIWDNLVYDFLSTINVLGAEKTVQKSNALLIDLLQLCMWRTCKVKVDDELNIPPQNEEVHYLHLSNLEKLFYSEQHAACENDFNENFTNYISRAKSTAEISPQIMKIFLEPLLKIRQCCTIPVINSNNANHLVGSKKFLQPKDLHAHLKSTNELDCKAELRSMASSYNGLAAIYFIRHEYPAAIRHYELVLKLAHDYNDLNINVDSLLQIHALHNILQAFYNAPNNQQLLPAETVTDYEDQCNKLEWKYLETYAAQMNRVQEAFEEEEKAYNLAITNTKVDLLTFVASVMDMVNDADTEHMMMERIYDECVNGFSNSEIKEIVSSIHSVLYTVTTWHDKVVAVSEQLIARFKQLRFFTANVRSRSQVSAAVWREMMKFFNAVYDCHLSEIRSNQKENQDDVSESSQAQKQKEICDLCGIRTILNRYECLLFNKVMDEETNLIEGLANPSLQINVIKGIFNFIKSRSKFHVFASKCEKHWDRIKCMQSMCKKMWKYWIEIEYTVKAYDELDMCKMRISLTQKEEEKSNFKLLDCEVNAMFREQQLNLQAAQTAFAFKLARLKYILHLEKNADPGACPICHSEDQPRYAVLECGHHICLDCLKTMKQFYKYQKLTCSVCRNQQNSKKVYFVTRANEYEATECDIKGNYSSKISFIVHKVLKLQREAGETAAKAPKIIIFSQWEPILTAIAAALQENNVRHRFRWSTKSIEEFKNPHLGITCMLMALSKGSKGLNLIEATHVFLVEPILNPAEELQAVGRVHRFGQTKPTTVHRFIVLNTIEENIYYTVTKGSETGSKWEFENMDLESLRSLFNLENDITDYC